MNGRYISSLTTPLFFKCLYHDKKVSGHVFCICVLEVSILALSAVFNWFLDMLRQWGILCFVFLLITN